MSGDIIQSEVSRNRNTNTVYEHIFMEFRKTITTTLYARQQKKHRCKELLNSVGEGKGGMIWENNIETHIYGI